MLLRFLESLVLTISVSLMLFAGITLSVSPPVFASTGKTVERHFVSFKFKQSTSKEQSQKVTNVLFSLKDKIPQVISIEYGVNNSPENLNKGFTQSFLITFANEKDRDIYLTHPEHEKFKALLKPLVDEVFVFDYLLNDGSTSRRNR